MTRPRLERQTKMSVPSFGARQPPMRDEFCFHVVRDVLVKNRMWAGVPIVAHKCQIALVS